MLPVEQPYKTYTGLDGKPLNNGYVYFGLPGENPITSPVSVFWDAAGTIPAAQPLRTINGYIVRAGTPANVFYEGTYSVLVRDSKGRQVFYAQDSAAFSIASAVANLLATLSGNSGSASVGFTQAGSDAVRRTVQSKLREGVPSIFDFLTESQIAQIQAGTATFNIDSKIQAKFNSLPALYFPPGVYPVWGTLRIKNANFRLIGAGKELVRFKAMSVMDKVIGVYGADDNPDSLIENIALSGFTVDGDGKAQNGLFVASCLSFNLYNDIDAVGCNLWGINHNRGFTNRARAVRCFNNTGGGFRMGKEVNQCDYDIEADNNGGHGILILGADGSRITGGVENNGANGLYVYSGAVPNIHGLDIDLRYVENNGTSNKSLYSGIRLETAGPSNIMEAVRIGTHFLNIAGEVGIHIGPNIQGITIGAIKCQNAGPQKALVLTSEYIDIPTVKAANIVVSRSGNLTASDFSVETASSTQIAATAEYVFEALTISTGGQFQPSILTGSDSGRTYGIRLGSSTKVGDRCHFTISISMSSKGTSTGPLDVGGLPYNSTDASFTAVNLVVDGLTYTGQLVALIPPAPAAFIRLYSQASGAGLVPLSEAALPASGLTLYLSGSYKIR